MCHSRECGNPDENYIDPRVKPEDDKQRTLFVNYRLDPRFHGDDTMDIPLYLELHADDMRQEFKKKRGVFFIRCDNFQQFVLF
jgi:hypothetical protein